jgi:hypothetical protein
MSRNARDASDSFNGFIYQRHVCIYLFLTHNDVEFILEEGQEDIDLITKEHISNKETITNSVQVKYHKYGTDETFQKNGGLYKVVFANYNKVNFEKITYMLFNQHNCFSPHLKNAFDQEKYCKLGKYFIIQYFNAYNENAIDIRITDINIVNKIYNDNISKICAYKDDKFMDIKSVFEERRKCIIFFSKIALEKGSSFSELNDKINNQIKINYAEFMNKTDNNSQNNIKVPLIFNCIYNILNEFIFENKNSNNRKIKVSLMKNKIDDLINQFENESDLLTELLKKQEQYLKNALESIDNDTANRLLKHHLCSNDLLNPDIAILAFYIDLLNKQYDKLDDNSIEQIKMYIMKSCFWLKNKDDFEYNKNLIAKINHIMHYNGNKSRYKTPKQKLINLFSTASVKNHKYF